MTFSGRFLLHMIQFAVRQGAAKKELLAAANFSQEALMDEDLRVEAVTYNAVVEAALAQVNDPFFGIHAGEHFNFSAAGLVAQITQTSATVKEALQYCCDFSMLACRAIPLSLEKADGEYVLRMKPRVWQSLIGINSYPSSELPLLTTSNAALCQTAFPVRYRQKT